MTGQARDEEDNQLYQRPQMTGQARDEEDNQIYQRPQMTGQARDEEEDIKTRSDQAFHSRNI